MTLSPEVLSGLRDRLAVATGPDREIDITMWRAFEDGAEESFVAGRLPLPWLYLYTASIDSALALVERMLPGWKWGVSSIAVRTGEKTAEGYPRYGEGFRAHVTAVSALRPMPSIGEAPTAPLAILLALLTALQENTK